MISENLKLAVEQLITLQVFVVLDNANDACFEIADHRLDKARENLEKVWPKLTKEEIEFVQWINEELCEKFAHIEGKEV